ncbi:hypothetical protein ACFLUY_03450, partial [Chloroflexota bacterium]
MAHCPIRLTGIVRFRQGGFLFIIGLILIVYAALGFLYLQQGAQQREFEEQIATLSAILSNPLAGGEELQAEYDAANLALAPMTDTNAIAMLVALAEENGLDIDKAADKFRVPTAGLGGTTVGGGSYQLISFRDIHAQGKYDDVMAFVSALDSGIRLENMVLTRLVTDEVEVAATGEEGTRRAEFRSVIAAVTAMMTDNALLVIPNPMNFRGGTAINLMGDDVNTTLEVEGFPDITTTAAA